MPSSTKHTLRKLRTAATDTVYVRHDSLKPAAWNPAIRVQLQYLHDLRDSIEAEGFWEFEPILVDRNGVIIDGHRRWTAAGLLHLVEVPVIIIDADADELWAKVNGTRMDLTGAQALQAVANGLQGRPAKYSKVLAKLEEVIGASGLQLLSQRGRSPNVYNQAHRIARYLGCENVREDMSMIVFWLVYHPRMNTIVMRAMADNVDPKIIEDAIRGNRPLQLKYQ